ncbi:MAG: nucleotidyltransferase domain-containing protein [Pseudomonadota bacterium]
MNEAVSADMRVIIKQRLKEIETEEGVRILFAIESGSRAWGFHSEDSDYDVRFVYARPREWHYRIGKKRDVIERPIDDELDISGWELGKALDLALGSKAVIAEWLQSPIRYCEMPEAVSQLTQFAKQALNRKSVTWHYISLQKRQASRVYAPDGSLRVKRWFYILRPALALRWMRLNDASVPQMNMAELRAGCDLDASLSDEIDALLRMKMAAHEKATMTNVDPRLEALVKGELEQAMAWVKTAAKEASTELRQRASDLHLSLSESACD